MNESQITIDPLKMNITSRICQGSKSVGTLEFDGGLLLQGEHHGKLTVKNGPLVIFEGGLATGEIHVEGDIYVFGKIGGEGAVESTTQTTATGTLYLAGKSVSYGQLRCAHVGHFKGAEIHGALDTTVHVKAEAK